MTTARITSLDHGITAIDTDYVRPLLDASHLVCEGGRAAFVDTGTNYSVPLLLDALRQRDLDPADVEFVFLTHVHLDHAGGAGLLMQRLPNARAVVHPRGARHMADPSKLITGAKSVYGEAAYSDMYGEIRPIDEDRIIVVDDDQEFSLQGRRLRCFFTEGHARHHYCLDDPQGRGVFTGDSFGVSYRELDTAGGEFIFPTTTPVHFDPAEAHRSIELIMGCDPEQLYLTHYSRVTELPQLATDMHRGIDDFVALARTHAASTARTADMEAAMFDYLSTRAREHGVVADDERLRAILGMDIVLNTQGLEFWLDHGSPTARQRS